MIRARFLAALPALLLAATTQAAEDPRLVEHMYDANEVVVLEGRPNVQAMIAFDDDETIESIGIGDSASWQVTPNKRGNLVFVKPLADDAATNMTVITDRRIYLFDLVASPESQPVYVLRFAYPEEPEDDKVQLAETASDLEMTAASDPYAVVDPAKLNLAWTSKGNAKLVPNRIFDDGEATYLSWEAGQAIPAILIKDEYGTEGPVNSAVRGDTTVVDGVPREIILRSGDDVATLINQGPVKQTSLALNGSMNGRAK